MVMPFVMACAIMFSLGGELHARLRVTKVSTSTVLAQRSLLRGNNTEVYDYFCDGKYTVIQRDANGKTQVYINASGYSTDESCRVKELDSLGIDWRYVNLFGGMEGDNVSCANVYIKMNSGQVGSITLRGDGKNNRVTSSAYLNTYGGTVDYIDASSNTVASNNARLCSWTYVYLSGLKYLGSCPIEYENTTYLRVFINTNCEFYETSARYSEDDPCEIRSLIAPDASTWSELYIKGSDGSIPSGHEVYCNAIVDSTKSSSSLYIYSNVHIKKCNGWNSERNISNYSRVSIPDHQHSDVLLSPATCTAAARYNSKCLTCNERLPSSYEAEALGHDTVYDARIASTCWRTGLTAGTHCGRCGLVFEPQTVISARSHSYSSITLDQTIIDKGCFIADSKTGTVVIKICKDCGYYVMQRGTEPNHIWTSVKYASTALKTTFKKFSQSATCVTDGLTVNQFCSQCNSFKTALISKYGHNFTSHDEVDPTCTESGMRAYQHCSRCAKDFLTDAEALSTNSIDTANLVLPAVGHNYLNYALSSDNLISEATCTEPSYFWSNCSRCGLRSNELKVVGVPALGHKYRFVSIVGTNDCSPMDGNMNIECENCNHTVNELSFELANRYGMDDVLDLSGYWCKSELVSIDTLPTCVDGWGTYRASICYNGQIVRGYYDNYIPACGYLHNYGDDGVCHETHYRMKMNSPGRINKNGYGCINYVSTSFDSRILDDSVYSTKGYVITPVKQPYKKVLGLLSSYVPDPENGTPMSYTDYLVTQYDSHSSLEGDLSNHTAPHYIGTVGSYDLTTSPIRNAANVLGIITHGDGPTFTIYDGNSYDATSDFTLSRLTYNRSFNNNLWQPLYIPFSIPVSELEDKGLQVARLNDTHMYDIDFDGTIDSVTVEFIRITSGTLQANRPYMVRSTSSPSKLKFILNNVALSKAVDNSIECSTVDQVISIVGTYSGLSTGVMYNNNYYALNKQGGLSRAATTSATLSPQRWYMKVENKDGSPIATNDYFAASIRVLGEWGDEQATGIEDLPTETAPEGERKVYSLDGMRVTDGQQRRGVYVDNGRRIVVH